MEDTMTTERLPVREYYSLPTIYADMLARIERHGPVSHLVFCHAQDENQDEMGNCLRVAIAACRVIVPTAILAQLARQLEHGPADTVEFAADMPEQTMQH
jgi:hypothetical protein